jgi:hypothetical protein
VSGCHTDAGAASAALNASAGVNKTLVDQIWVDVDGDRAVDSATDGGYLSKVPKGEFKTNDNFLSVAEGALYNAQLWGIGLASHPDGSRGAHNPFLAQRQLAATIDALKTTYGLPAPPAAVQRLMDEGRAKAKALGAAVPLSLH